MKLSAILLLSASLVSAQPQSSANGQDARSAAGLLRPADPVGESAQPQMIQARRTAPARTRPGNQQVAHSTATPAAAVAATTAQPQFSTGQAARLVIGQPRFSSQRSETSRTLVGAAQGIAFANGALIVADANRQGAYPLNNRVLIYQGIRSYIPDLHDEIVQNGTPCPICLGYQPGNPPPAGTVWPGATNVLGQQDYVTTLPNQLPYQTSTQPNPPTPPTATTMRTPVAVAYNGMMLAVADAENNRILIWKSLPVTDDQAADFVVGQPDFAGYKSGQNGLYGFPIGHCSKTSLRSPSGVYLDANNGLWVADTGNDRVLYYGPITGNNQPATLVLGQADFDHDTQNFYTLNTTASSLFAPTSVSSDGQHLIIADNFQNRVLIWDHIPTSNNEAANVVVGQKDFASNYSNTYSTTVDSKNVVNPHSELCASNGSDTTTETGVTIPLYPNMCAGTLSAPMSAISDGTRLFIADSGNDRVLVYNQIPTTNGAPADVILGQIGEFVDDTSDSNAPQGISSAYSFKGPNSLATDGTNLYVADTFNRRIAVFTPGDFQLPIAAVRSAASPFVYAQGTVTVAGTPEDNDTLTITIGNNTVKDTDGNVIKVGYSYAESASNSLTDIVKGLANAINSANNGAGDPWVTAIADPVASLVILKAKQADLNGNSVTVATSTSLTSPKTTLTASGTTLSGGQDSAMVAPYSLVLISGGLNQKIVNANASQLPPVQPLDKKLPTSLGGVEFYVDGIKCPLVAVTPTSFVAQMPIELAFALEPDTIPPDPNTTVNVTDTLRFPRTASGVVRVTDPDGTIRVSSAIHIPVIQQNPSLFYDSTRMPYPGVAFHSSSQSTATISIDGSIQGGDQATVLIRDRGYTYTVQPSDALDTVRDALIALINASDPEVQASAAGPFDRIRLKAYLPGPMGNNIPISTSVTSSALVTAATSTAAAVYASAKILLTAFNSHLCCANIAGAPITTDNPAVPGETISVYGTGLGRLQATSDFVLMVNGQPFQGSESNNVTDNGFVYPSVGGKSANLLFSGLQVGSVGLYRIDMELNTSLPTDPKTSVTISQLYQTSNIITIPVVATAPAN